MKIFSPNSVQAKSRFWYFIRFLKNVKKAHGEIVACDQVNSEYLYFFGVLFRFLIIKFFFYFYHFLLWCGSFYSLILHAFKKRYSKENHWKSKILLSGWDTIQEVVHTTCTENTETWPLKVQSHNAIVIWVQDTEPELTQFKSWKSKLLQLTNAEDQTSPNTM